MERIPVTGSLSPIYNSLNRVAPYHPFEADTYADWSLEAGDIVTISRDGTSYSSPVHSTSLVWRGQPEMHISSTGKEKRDSIAQVSQRKFASRGGGVWNSQSLYWELYSDDGQLNAVVRLTSSVLSAKMMDLYNGLMSYIEFTAEHLLIQFWGLYDGLSSEFELTRSRLYVSFIGLYDGLKSYTEITRSRLYTEFHSLYDGLNSNLEVTRSRIYTEFHSLYDGLNSTFEVTRSRIYTEFYSMYDGLRSSFEVTRSKLSAEFFDMYDGLGAEFELTRSRLYYHFYGLYDGLNSTFELTRSRMRVEFWGLYDGLSSSFELTRSRMRVEFLGLYDGLSSNFEVTRSRMRAEFYGLYDGLNSNFEVTRSRLRVEFYGLYDGLNSNFEVTRSRMRAEFYGLYDGLSSTFEVTRSRLYVDFYGLYDGLMSNFEVTRSRLRTEFYGLYDGLSSNFEVTRSRMRVEFYGLYDGLNSNFEVTRSRLRVEFYGLYDGLNSNFEVTRSRMRVEFYGLYDGLSANFEITRSRMSAAFVDAYNGLSSEFIRTASSWTSQFNNTYTNLSSMIEQEAGKISLIVEGTGSNAHIKPAAIQAGINAATGQSKIQLSADHIQLDGDVVASALTVDDPITVASVNAQAAKSYFYDFQFEDPMTGEGPYQSGEILVSAYVDNDNTLHILNAAGDETTFSKAASGITALTGSWSGGTLTVATVPASGHTFVNTPSLAFNGDGTHSFSADMSAVDSAGTNAVRNRLYGYLELTGSGSSSSVVARTDSGSFASLPVGSLYTSGQNSVNVSKGTWASGVLALSTSAGTGTGAEVRLTKDTAQWNGNTASVKIYDGQSVQSGSDTGYTVTVDASGRYTAGQNSVNVSKDSWSSGQISFSPSAGSGSGASVQLTAASTTWDGNTGSRVIWDGTAADAQHGVSTGYTVSIDATARYTAGQNNVTITKGTWTGGQVTFSKSAGAVSNSGVKVRLDVEKSGNNYYYMIYDDWSGSGVSTGYSGVIDASSVYTSGQNDVTITKGNWSNGQITFSKSAGTASNKTVQLTAATTTWDGNTGSRVIWDGTAADASHGVSTGYTVSIDATARYTAGQNNVTISKGSWSGGQITFSKSAGTASNSGVRLSLDYERSGNNYYYLIYDYWSGSGISTDCSGVINASAVYDDGYDVGFAAGRNNVTISKGNWSSGQITFSKSAGTASNSGVRLSLDYEKSGNKYYYLIYDYWSGSGVSTDCSGVIDAQEVYDAGYAAGSGSSSTISNARTRFSAGNGSFWVESYDSVTSGAPAVSGSSITYKLKCNSSGVVQIVDTNNAKISNTAECNVWFTETSDTTQSKYKGLLAYNTLYGLSAGGEIIATWKTPPATSHSIEVSKSFSAGGSSYSTGGKLNGGGISKSGLSVNTYCYIKVKCDGGNEKEIYFPINS